MKEMANFLGQRLANMSLLGQDVNYNSIHYGSVHDRTHNSNNANILEFSKVKGFLDDEGYSSTRSKLLGTEAKHLCGIIDSKIE